MASVLNIDTDFTTNYFWSHLYSGENYGGGSGVHDEEHWYIRLNFIIFQTGSLEPLFLITIFCIGMEVLGLH